MIKLIKQTQVQFMACPNSTTTPPKRLAGFKMFNLRLEPTQQRHHQNVLQDLYTTTTPPKRLAGFNKNITDDDVNSDHLKAQHKSTKHQGCNLLENHQ
jgi:hypothetical protein